MNITVYLGASLGNDPALPQAVQQLGRWIGESGNALVYGGSKSGLMGLLADSVLAAGGRVTGVGYLLLVAAHQPKAPKLIFTIQKLFIALRVYYLV